MPQETLQNMLPAFYKMGTLADMSMMARKVALARKAVKEIRDIEDILEKDKGTIADSDFKIAMKETGDYAIVAANAISEAIEILKDVKRKVESYQEEIHDVAD